jgi:hypothetical protein
MRAARERRYDDGGTVSFKRVTHPVSRARHFVVGPEQVTECREQVIECGLADTQGAGCPVGNLNAAEHGQNLPASRPHRCGAG